LPLPNRPWSDLLRPDLLHKELAGLLSGRAFWVLLLVQALLTGLSYTLAVGLYAEASRTALQTPAMAVGMAPLDGVLVPTFGSLYLGLTLLFPFVAIRQVSRERGEGMLPLLLQTRVPLWAWLGAKLLALGLAALLVLAVPLSALAFWGAAGGHLAAGETASLILGYALYALLITAIACLAAALMDSAAGAAILTLSVTLGAWALDFAATGDRGWVHGLGGLSITAVLRRFESALVTLTDVVGLTAAGLAAVTIAGLWLHPLGWKARTRGALAAVLVALGMGLLAGAAGLSWDASENRRHSFPPAETNALAQIHSPLRVTVHLVPADPRLADLERNVLDKLGRVLPSLDIRIWGASGLFAAQDEDGYGLIELDLALPDGTRHAQTRSTSSREILPLIFDLAGTAPAAGGPAPAYPGYPLVADARTASLWFFLGLPTLVGLAWWRWGRF
jgi:ABC-type transport system involved in multi-copper enzyme maturation permease subunit